VVDSRSADLAEDAVGGFLTNPAKSRSSEDHSRALVAGPSEGKQVHGHGS
jgi:hypothetical protein